MKNKISAIKDKRCKKVWFLSKLAKWIEDKKDSYMLFLPKYSFKSAAMLRTAELNVTRILDIYPAIFLVNSVKTHTNEIIS